MTERRPLIAGNWKMYKTGPEAVDFVKTFKSMVSGVTGVDIMIAPPFTALSLVAPEIDATNSQLGAQNLHWHPEGDYTGEIATGMLTASGCRYAIIGHSERRQYFGETDKTSNYKIEAATRASFAPLFFSAETESQSEVAMFFTSSDKQVENGLKGQLSELLESMFVFYEPVWANGTGKIASTAQGIYSDLKGNRTYPPQPKIEQGLRIPIVREIESSYLSDIHTASSADRQSSTMATKYIEPIKRIQNSSNSISLLKLNLVNCSGNIDVMLLCFVLATLGTFVVAYLYLITSNAPVPDELREGIKDIIAFCLGLLTASSFKK